MDLKYITKNDGYIIDRKFTNAEKLEGQRTYVEIGTMVLSEILPVDNEEMEKSATECAFDSMKDNILNTIKKKYSVSSDGIYNFYFEGNVKKDENSKIYAKFQDEEIPVVLANFNLNFEAELAVTPRNFLKTWIRTFQV